MILPLFFFVSYYDVNNYYTESHYVIGSVGKSPNYQPLKIAIKFNFMIFIPCKNAVGFRG